MAFLFSGNNFSSKKQLLINFSYFFFVYLLPGFINEK